MTKLLSALLILLSSTVTAQQTFYISSSSGNDANSGTSSAAPRKTIPTLKPRNTYLLKRGDIFYQKIKRVYNPTVGYTITVGAYGTGSKPVLSLYAVISSSAWVLDSTNRWKANFSTFAGITGAVPPLVSSGPDVGFLKLNGKTIKGAKKKTKSSLAAQWDFYSGSTYLYVYSTVKPSSLASRIEAATDNSGISISDNMNVQDIRIIGAGHHGIGTAKQNNIIIRNVEVSEIGGGYLPGGTTRYGNGIQLYDGGSNSLIENCLVKHVYDVAYTLQSASSSGIQVFKNITFRNNVADSCEQSFELAMYNQANQPGYVNCRITGNNFRNAGYSWGHYLRPRIRGVHLLSYFPAGMGTATQFDLIYENNTFFRARDGLYYSDYGGTKEAPLPPYKSRNNKIWLDATTYIRMKIAGGATTYPWTVKTYQDFVTKNGKEVGSTWNVIGGTAHATSSILITSPENNATISPDSTLKIEASPAELASFQRVDFYLGSDLIGSDTSSPYALEVENPGEGTYQLTAKAIGKDSSVSVSTPVAISIKAKQKGPSVAISHPANHTSFTQPEIINISATVLDSNGSIRTVEFFNGDLRLGVGTAVGHTGNREFKLVWSNPPAGAYQITAKAIDTSGKAAVSEPIEIKVSAETAFSFTTFSGDTANNSSRLTWETNRSKGVRLFKIQRGKTIAELSDIGEIRPSTDIAHNGQYSFLDNSPLTGKNFYRIAQVDNAGNVIFSDVLALDNARRNAKIDGAIDQVNHALSREDVQISPNPVSSVMTIRIQNLKQSEGATLSILSLSGVLIKTIKANNTITEVDLSSLKPGTYVLQTLADGQVINKQFIKL